jgi:hypothetical protein
MSFWANVIWANVLLGKCRMGKCLWANVVWANVMEPVAVQGNKYFLTLLHYCSSG